MILTKTFSYRGKEVTYDKLRNHSMIPIEVKCDRCDDVFMTTKYQLVRNGHELCRACALRVKQEKIINVGTKFGKLTVIGQSERAGYSTCECECGNVKDVSNINLKNGTTKSCGCLRVENGKRIASEYLSKYQHGEDHPMWKGGISPERNCIEKTKAYKNFRKCVLDRDKHTCVVCGSTDDLCIHHLFDFTSYPEKRTNVDNAVCLCRSCHRAFHHAYGLNNTTPEQFSEFRKNCQ